ncbi:MAG: hypothetical protein IT368_16545 [Candidatus Hydrogenedentes bacterium]|nr:hypothetical protein [Candidatus Hydrogenedentota bacterium]
MNHVSVVALKTDLDRVLRRIASLRLMHPAHVEETHQWAAALASMGTEQAVGEYTQRERRLRQICEGLSVTALAPSTEPMVPQRLEELDQTLDQIEGRASALLLEQKELRDRKNEIAALMHQMALLLPMELPLHNLFESSFLYTAMGLIAKTRVQGLANALAGVPAVLLPIGEEGGRQRVLCVVLRRDAELLDRALREAGFEAVPAPVSLDKAESEADQRFEQELADIENRLSVLDEQIAALRADLLPEVAAAHHAIEAALILLRVQTLCKTTEHTCVFSGWVPQARTKEFADTVARCTEGRGLVEVIPAEEFPVTQQQPIDVPVSMASPRLLRPFRILTEGFGVPAYYMIDPTIFVAATFLFMFGMMFGDVGHGLVLLVAGVALALRVPRAADAGRVAACCGVSSMIFGALYGSFFGFEHVIPALWLRPLENISTLFFITICFGIGFISLGLVLNAINAARRGNLLRAVFESTGPLVAVAYWAGIGLAVRALTLKEIVPAEVLAVLLVAPFLLLLAKGPLLRLLGQQDRAFPEGFGVYAMEGVIEVLEAFMSYLANTVSFIRVAAFGLAHAGLFLAVFGIADMISDSPIGGVLHVLVIVIGNVVIVLLEGLVVVIQALRLEYYEFFGKFFHETGTKFDPVGSSWPYVLK